MGPRCTSMLANAGLPRGRKFQKEGDLKAFGRALYASSFMTQDGFPFGRSSHKDNLLNEELGLPKQDLDDRTRYYGIELSKDTARWVI